MAPKNLLLLRLFRNLLVLGPDKPLRVRRPSTGITRALPTEEGPQRRQLRTFLANAVFDAQQLDLHAIPNVRVVRMIYRVGDGVEPLAIRRDMRKPVLRVLTVGDLLG